MNKKDLFFYIGVIPWAVFPLLFFGASKEVLICQLILLMIQIIALIRWIGIVFKELKQ